MQHAQSCGVLSEHTELIDANKLFLNRQALIYSKDAAIPKSYKLKLKNINLIDFLKEILFYKIHVFCCPKVKPIQNSSQKASGNGVPFFRQNCSIPFDSAPVAAPQLWACQ